MNIDFYKMRTNHALLLYQRWHVCYGIEMQRHLYSAFLAKCVDTEISALYNARARMLWQGIELIRSEAISRAIQTAIGERNPTSFGFNKI